MKKRVLSVVLAFVMLTASFAGSLRFDELNGITDLVTASAEEQTGTIKTKYDKTLLFADDAAFDAEFARLRDELLPEFREAIKNINTVDDVINGLKIYDECINVVSRLSDYGKIGMYLDGTDTTAIEQYNRVSALYQEFIQITMAAGDEIVNKDESFIYSIFEDERLEPWHKMLIDLISQATYMPSEYSSYLLAPAEIAKGSYLDIYSTLRYSDLKYETVTKPDGSKVKANYLNVITAQGDSMNPEFFNNIAETYNKTLKNYENTFAGLLDNYISISESLASRYGYSSVLEMSAINSGITPEIVMNLIKEANQNADVLSRYSQMKAKAFGRDSSDSGSRSSIVYAEPDVDFKFENARKILTEALAPLGDEYITVLNKAFDEGWIDAYPEDNKFNGGITVGFNDIAPCVIVNYMDDYNSLTTLAHELGHAINLYLSAENQTSAYSRQPVIITDEITSITNELLLAEYMEKNAKTEKERLYYLMQEFDIININFFTASFYSEFEYKIRNIVNNGGVLTADVLNENYKNTYAEYYNTEHLLENYEDGWINVFQLYSPFYNICYSTSVSAAINAANKISNGDKNAVENYITFLKAGSSASPQELYALAGTDLTDSNFAQPLLDRCNEIINESDAIVAKYAG